MCSFTIAVNRKYAKPGEQAQAEIDENGFIYVWGRLTEKIEVNDNKLAVVFPYERTNFYNALSDFITASADEGGCSDEELAALEEIKGTAADYREARELAGQGADIMDDAALCKSLNERITNI